MRLSDIEWQVAKQVCTDRQRVALDWWRRGYGYGLIGLNMDIDKSTARQHVERGKRRIVKELERLERIAA